MVAIQLGHQADFAKYYCDELAAGPLGPRRYSPPGACRWQKRCDVGFLSTDGNLLRARELFSLSLNLNTLHLDKSHLRLRIPASTCPAADVTTVIQQGCNTAFSFLRDGGCIKEETGLTASTRMENGPSILHRSMGGLCAFYCESCVMPGDRFGPATLSGYFSVAYTEHIATHSLFSRNIA